MLLFASDRAFAVTSRSAMSVPFRDVHTARVLSERIRDSIKSTEFQLCEVFQSLGSILRCSQRDLDAGAETATGDASCTVDPSCRDRYQCRLLLILGSAV